MRYFLRPILSGAIFLGVLYLAFLFFGQFYHYHPETAHDAEQTRMLFLIAGPVGLIVFVAILIGLAGLFGIILVVAYLLSRTCWRLLSHD
jgi:hypothetical protein